MGNFCQECLWPRVFDCVCVRSWRRSVGGTGPGCLPAWTPVWPPSVSTFLSLHQTSAWSTYQVRGQRSEVRGQKSEVRSTNRGKIFQKISIEVVIIQGQIPGLLTLHCKVGILQTRPTACLCSLNSPSTIPASLSPWDSPGLSSALKTISSWLSGQFRPKQRRIWKFILRPMGRTKLSIWGKVFFKI